MDTTNTNEIKLLNLVLSLHDQYTQFHTARVQQYSIRLSIDMELSAHENDVINLASQFHDIGKIGIPQSVLTSTTRISEEDMVEIKKHPIHSEVIIRQLCSPYAEEAGKVARHHHEYVNGKGYPDKLSDSEIPILSKIIAIADNYDAIISNRSYHSHERSLSQTLDIMDAKSGIELDDDIYKKFKILIERGI